MRTDDKWLNKARNKAVEPRSPIRRCKLTTSNEQGLETTKKTLVFSFGFTTQKELFDFVWSTRKHICVFTGEDLNRVPSGMRHWCCMHILRKGSYTYWKYNPHNIVLGYPDFHVAADNFTEEERTKHPTWNFDLFFEMQEKLKQQYKQFLLDNML